MLGKKDELNYGGSMTETIVGSSVKLKGTLKSEGDITIDGNINGEIKTRGTVTVGPNANIIASIIAKNINISGTVQGNVIAEEKLSITETGRVFGDITANIISISPGALFTGKSNMSEKINEPEFEPIIEESEIADEVELEKTKEKSK